MLILDTAGDTIQAEGSAASSITVSCYGIETTSGTDNYKRLGVAQLTGAATQDTIYTVPASMVTICSVIVIANTSGSARTIKLWDVENGGSPGDANAILGTVTIAANSSIIWNKGNITEIPNAAGSGGSNHNILDGSVHPDSVADAVTRGSIIFGNSTPTWDELVIGAADTFLGSDGTDVSYRTAAQVLVSLSGEAGAAFSFGTQNLTSVGAIGCGAITGTSTGLFEGASVTVGKASTTTGTLVLHDSNSANTITLTVPDISAGSLSFTLPPTDGDDTDVLQTNGSGVLTWVDGGAGITVIIDGGGAEIGTGIAGDLDVPFDCSIQSVTMLADQSGSIVIDIWSQAYADYPPEDAQSITASAVPTITTAEKSTDATLTGWTTALTKGDTLRFNVDSVTSIERVTLSLKVNKT